jgi:hypothetical protein
MIQGKEAYAYVTTPKENTTTLVPFSYFLVFLISVWEVVRLLVLAGWAVPNGA